MAPNGTTEMIAIPPTNEELETLQIFNSKVYHEGDEIVSGTHSDCFIVMKPLKVPSEYPEEEEDRDSGYDEGRASESDEEREHEYNNLVIDERDSSPIPSLESQDTEHNGVLEKNKSTCTGDEKGKIRRRAEIRNESVKKMRHGKHWLLKTLIFVESAVCTISLRSVVDKYRCHCQSTNRNPVTTPVLARLIRSVFSQASKCRVGPRGNQKIHYRNLKWRHEVCDSSFSDNEILDLSCNQDQEEDQLQNHQDSQVGLHDNESLTTKYIKSEKEQEVEESVKNDNDKQVQEGCKDVHPSTEKKECKNSEDKEEEQEEKLLVGQAPERRNPGTEATNKDNQGECETAAEGLSRVIKWMYEQNKMMILLRYFAHSASCRTQTCSPICLMFRRVRRHVVGARHACSVLQVYSTLLRTHVSSCSSTDCGLPACPVLRFTQERKRVLRQGSGAAKRTRTLSVVQPPQSPTISSTPASPITPPVNGSTQIVYVPVMMQLADPRGA